MPGHCAADQELHFCSKSWRSTPTISHDPDLHDHHPVRTADRTLASHDRGGPPRDRRECHRACRTSSCRTISRWCSRTRTTTAYARPGRHSPVPTGPSRSARISTVPSCRSGSPAQWVAGGGSPLVFRSPASCSMRHRPSPSSGSPPSCCRSRPPGWSLRSFAVHPLHVEAVAVAVNQGELIVGLIATLWVGCYLRARRRGATSACGACIGFVATYLVACFFKENAVILPGLLHRRRDDRDSR